MKRIQRANSPRKRTPGRKKLRGGQLVVPANPLEMDIYVNFTIAAPNTISAATSTDGKVTVASTGPGTISLNITSSTLTTLKDYTIFGYNGSAWAEIQRGNIDMGGSSVLVYGKDKGSPIRKVSGVKGQQAGTEIILPAPPNSFGSVLNFSNLTTSMFAFVPVASPITTNVYIQLIFTSNFTTPSTKQGGWLPNLVPGLSLWLDAIEPGVNGFVPNTAITIPSWRDKSGNNNHATVPAGSEPAYKSNPSATGTNKMGVYFNGSTNYFSGPIQNAANYCCIFAVTGADVATQTGARVISLGKVGIDDATGTNAYASLSITTTGAANTTTYAMINSSVSAASYAVDSTNNVLSMSTSWINSTSTSVLVNGIIKAVFTGSITTAAYAFGSVLTVTAITSGIITVGMTLSGTGIPSETVVTEIVTANSIYNIIIKNVANATATSIASTTITGVCTAPIYKAINPNLNLSKYSIGKNNSAANFFKGYLHEILVYTTPLTKQARQTIEGYLAWKWNITLDASHPYNQATPSLNAPIKPIPLILQNSPALLWLDGQDPLANEGSAFPTNSTLITGWYDKSGNNNHAVTTSTFAPRYLANSVVFNGTSSYLLGGVSYPKFSPTIFGVKANGSTGTDVKSCIAFNSGGIGFFTNYSEGTVNYITPTGTVTQLATGFSYPSGITVDSKGVVYFAQRGAHSIVRMVVTGTPGSYTQTNSVIIGVSGSQGSVPQTWCASFTGSITANVLTVSTINVTTPVGFLAIGARVTDGTNIKGYIASYGTGTGSNIGTYILRDSVDVNAGTALYSYRLGNLTTGNNCKLINPSGIVFDKNNILYFVDWNHAVYRGKYTGPAGGESSAANWSVDCLAGGYTTNKYGSGSGSVNGDGDIALFSYPVDIAVDATGQYLYVSDRTNNSIRKIVIATRVVSTILNSANSPAINTPKGIAFDQFGILYIANSGSNSILVFDTGATQAYTLIASASNCGGVACYGTNVYYCLDGNPVNIMYTPMPRPTYMYSPVAPPITNYISVFVVCTVSGYNRLISSILSLGSNSNTESYTTALNSGTVTADGIVSGATLGEDAGSSSYIGLYNDNGQRDVFRNNIRVQGSMTTIDAPATVSNFPPNLLYFSSSPTSLSLRVNGTAATASPSLASSTFSYFNIGSYGLGLQPSNIRRITSLLGSNSSVAMNYAFDGAIYEVIIYTNDMAIAQTQFIEAYLSWKWKIPLKDATNPLYTSDTAPAKLPTDYATTVPTDLGTMLFKNITATTFDLSWTGGSDAAAYKYTILPSSGITTTDKGVSDKYVRFTGITPSTTYTITITSSNTAGNGTLRTTIFTLPTAVMGVSVSLISLNNINVTWSGGAGATSYNYSITPTIATNSSGNTSSNSVIFNGLILNISYTITITPVNSTGSYSGTAGTWIGMVPLAPITSLAVTYISSTAISLTWSGANGAVIYTITGATPSGYNGITQYATFSTLNSSSSYTIIITGYNGGSNTGPATIIIPAAPSNLTATAITSAQFTLTFTASAGATSYKIYDGGVLMSPQPSPIAASGTTITGTAGQGFNITMTAIIGGTEIWPSAARLVQLPPTPVTSVTLVAGSLNANGFILSWQGGAGATSYTFTGAQPASYDMAAKTATFSGLNSSSSYTITIKGVAGGVNSTGGTFTIDAAPSNLTATAITWAQFTLTFTAVPGATSYKIYDGGVLMSPQPSPIAASGTTITGTTEHAFNITMTAIIGGTEMWASATALYVLLPPAAPTPITNVTYTNISATRFTISWSGGIGATSYTFTYTSANVGPQPTITGNTAVFVGAEGSTNYTGNLVAQNRGGSVSYSCTVTTTAYKINTIAGGAKYMSYLVNTPASASYVGVFGVDKYKNVYVFDPSRFIINKLDITTGLVSIYVGTKDTSGSTGDNGLATSATISSNVSVILFNSSNDMYIADAGNSMIRMVRASDGKILPIISSANDPYLGSVTGLVLDSLGNIFWTSGVFLRKYDKSTSNISTFYRIPVGTAGTLERLAIDSSNNLYTNTNASSLKSATILKFTPSGIQTVIAGTGAYGYSGDGGAATSAQMKEIAGLALDSIGNLYISESGSLAIRKVDTNGIISTVGGKGASKKNYNGAGGPLSDLYFGTAQLNIVIDSSDNIYCLDKGTYRIYKYVAATGIVTVVYGPGTYINPGDGGPATSAGLYNPQQIAYDSYGNLYIADFNNCRVRMVAVGTNIITTIAGGNGAGNTGDGGLATDATLNFPQGVALDSLGNIYISTTLTVRMVEAATNIITTIVGSNLYGNTGDNGAALSAKFMNIGSIAYDSTSSTLYICDSADYRVRKVVGGIISACAGTNNLASSGASGITAITCGLKIPAMICVDSTGNIYISEIGNNTVRKITKATGIITNLAAGLTSLGGISVDSSGNVYAYSNYYIKKITPLGVVTNLAGTGVNGYTGDTGLALSATISPSVYTIACSKFKTISFTDMTYVIRELY